ncbi:NB-ARC domain-containing protein [Streptomyces clavifer]|uniref:NB-ARC domain-containing protein n=1 Tax=Streptomyces clavifer TaxID=68188 RepID=UPI0036656BFC
MAAWLQLRPPAALNDPPPPPPVVVPDWFVDRAQTRAAAAAVCRGGRAVGITTSLWGAGGFGKTTLATAVCARRRVRWRFRSQIFPLRPRIYCVTIGRDVRGRAAVAARVVEVTRFITGDTTEFDDPDLAGAHLGRLLDRRPRTLIVLDDVWEGEQLAPFLTGGRRCVRLVTTRNPALLPSGTQSIPVDQMSYDQAKAVLTWNLSPLPEFLVNALLEATGRWALLLRLTNRLIGEQCAAGADPTATAERILHRLRDRGPAAVDDPATTWDLDDPRLRNQAVKASIEAATTLLPPGAPARFAELGIFAEDESIPIAVVALLWQAGGQLTEDQTRILCRDLERLSLLSLSPRNGGTISLHDVIRDYLRSDLGSAGLVRLNGLLIDTIATTLPLAQPLAPTTPAPERAWWQIRDGYLLDHLIDHMLAAGRTPAAEAVAGDLRWVESRLTQRGPTAPWTDLTRIGTPHIRPLARGLAQTAHLLTPTDPPHALIGILHTRLDTDPHWHPQITARQHDPAQRPRLMNRWPLPDAPSPALHRTLTGHTSTVTSVAIAPDGTWLATTSNDGTVRIWDRVTGTCTATLTGHTSTVTSVTIAPSGTSLATTSSDGRVRIWDRVTGTCTSALSDYEWLVALGPDHTWIATTSSDGRARIWGWATGTCTAILTGHTDWVRAVAIAPDGTWIATTSDDKTARIWDRATATCTATLTGHTDSVRAMAIAPDGTWIATTSDDKTARIWDRATGTCTTILTGHTDWVRAVAIAPDGTWIATTSNDKTTRIWDRATATCTAVLTGHTSTVTSVAIAPDNTWLATTSNDKTTRIWDPTSAAHDASRSGPTNAVTSVAIAPDSTWIATTSSDGTARIWDRATATCTAILTGHTDWVRGVAIAPDGTWIATTSSDATARLWDRATATCTATLTGHTDSVRAVAIAPDNTWLATTSDDGTARIWDRATATCTATLTGHTGSVRAVAIAPDGTWIATTSNDKTTRIWAVLSQRAVAMARAEGALISCSWGAAGELAVGGDRGLFLFVLLT